MVWSKESRQSRGYDAEWEKVRALVVVRDKGLCQCCSVGGRVTIGKEVDHKVPKAEAARLGWSRAQTDHPSNLWLLCKGCHAEKTAKENGRVLRVKVEFGEDGWPLDKAQ
jgi:5-methylcytosine-specific restriction protein A